MKTIIKAVCMLVALWAFASCQDDGLFSNVQEGLPCSVTLSVSVPAQQDVHNSRATDKQETTVENLALFFYKKYQPDELPVVVEITEMGEPTIQTSTNYIYNVTLQSDEVTSGHWYLYAVANYGKNFVHATLDELKNKTKAEMDEFCTSSNADELDFVETGILMSGKYEQEAPDGALMLNPGNNTLKGDPCLVLRRLISKSIFKFINGDGVTFVPESYELHNYSTSSTVMERIGWADKDGNLSDGEKGKRTTHPGNLTYKGNANSLKTKEDISITGKTFANKIEAEADKDGTFFFYTQENVQPNNAEVTDYNDREKRDNRTATEEGTFINAPKDATYVVVKGRYSGPGGKDEEGNDIGDVTGNVEYTIHLGDFSKETGANGNFTVRRNVKYTYNVTVKGVNNIIVEATTDVENQSGAEGDIMKLNSATNVCVDAHYEQVLLPLNVSLPLDGFSLQIITPYTSKTIQKVEDFADTDDIEWIMFGAPATATTFKTYAEAYSAGLINIKDLLKELQNGKTDHCLVSDGKVYVAAYVNEYYYEGKTNELARFVNADNRVMRWSTDVRSSSDKHSTFTTTPIFSIEQRSIKSMMNLGMANPFGLETVEEEGAQKYLTKDYKDPQESSGATSSSFGWENYSRVFATYSSSNWTWNQLWSTYIDESKNGFVDGVRQNAMKTDYDYALYCALSRNRDNDHDGTIDQDEIRWYLPSQHQCLTIWYGNNSLPAESQIDVSGRENKTYLTSTSQPVASGKYTANDNRIWYAAQGAVFGPWRKHSGFAEQYWSNPLAIRAVRSLKTYNAEVSKVSTWDSTNRIATIRGLSDECVRSYVMTGEYASHFTAELADRLPLSFQVAKAYLEQSSTDPITAAQAVVENIGANYFEADDESDKGQWRVPNEKELGLMLEYLGKDVLKEKTIARTRFNDGSIKYYWRNPDGNITTNNKVTGTTNIFVLLVRDVPATSSGGDSGTTTTKSSSSYFLGKWF